MTTDPGRRPPSTRQRRITSSKYQNSFCVAWLGALVIGALAWHAVTKLPDHLAEMLWVCHVASLVLAIGLLTGRQALVAAGLLLHLSREAPAYLLDVIAHAVDDGDVGAGARAAGCGRHAGRGGAGL